MALNERNVLFQFISVSLLFRICVAGIQYLRVPFNVVSHYFYLFAVDFCCFYEVVEPLSASHTTQSTARIINDSGINVSIKSELMSQHFMGYKMYTYDQNKCLHEGSEKIASFYPLKILLWDKSKCRRENLRIYAPKHNFKLRNWNRINFSCQVFFDTK